MTAADEKLDVFVAGLAELEATSLLAGLYLVGSHALGDVRPNSDIDFIAVMHRSPQDDELSTLAALHNRLRVSCPDPPLDGLYVSVPDLLRPAEDVVPLAKYLAGERVEAASGAVTPVEWFVLKRRGVRLMGQPVGLLDVNVDVEALRGYCRRNLVEYWTPQVQRLGELAQVESFVRWVANRVEEIALGVPRLLASIATGDVLSKTEAGRDALERFPESSAVLEASLEQRRHPLPERLPVLAGMAPDVVAFGRRCIAVALSHSSGSIRQ